MTIKYPVMYFIAGLIFGVFLMWGLPKSQIGISDNQLSELSITISKDIRSQLSKNVPVTSSYETAITPSGSIDISNELIDELKDELKLVIADELHAYKSEMLASINNSNSEKAAVTDNDYEQYHQAQLMLNDIANGAQVSFQEFASDPKIKSLPDELRNKLMGEVAMKLTSGELSPDLFLGVDN